MGGFHDYATDNRGDVGSWVREAAMNGAETLIRVELQRVSAGGTEAGPLGAMCASAFPGLVKQAVRKTPTVRTVL